MSLPLRKVTVSIMIVMILLASCEARRKRFPKAKPTAVADGKTDNARQSKLAKQLELRETNPPNFLRILIMRLIYGFAAQMNLEERVSGWFNGAFVPPNADYDDYGFGGLGDFGADGLFE